MVAYIKAEKNDIPVDMGQELHGGEVRRTRGIPELDARRAMSRLMCVRLVSGARHHGCLCTSALYFL